MLGWVSAVREKRGTRLRLTVRGTGGGGEHSILPNLIAKPKGEKKQYFGDQIDGIKDISNIGLRRPVDRVGARTTLFKFSAAVGLRMHSHAWSTAMRTKLRIGR